MIKFCANVGNNDCVGDICLVDTSEETKMENCLVSYHYTRGFY